MSCSDEDVFSEITSDGTAEASVLSDGTNLMTIKYSDCSKDGSVVNSYIYTLLEKSSTELTEDVGQYFSRIQ